MAILNPLRGKRTKEFSIVNIASLRLVRLRLPRPAKNVFIAKCPCNYFVLMNKLETFHVKATFILIIFKNEE